MSNASVDFVVLSFVLLCSYALLHSPSKTGYFKNFYKIFFGFRILFKTFLPPFVAIKLMYYTARALYFSVFKQNPLAFT